MEITRKSVGQQNWLIENDKKVAQGTAHPKSLFLSQGKGKVWTLFGLKFVLTQCHAMPCELNRYSRPTIDMV